MAEGNGEPLEPWFVELVAFIRTWHDVILAESGGLAGEHSERLEACIGRAFQTASGMPVYPTDFEKAAALFHGIVTSHPFVDGNKRTATATAILFLASRGVLGPDAIGDLHVRLLGEVALTTASVGMEVGEVHHWMRRIFDQ